MKRLILAVLLTVAAIASQSTAQQSAPVADIPAANEFNLTIEPDVLKDVSEPADSTIEENTPPSGGMPGMGM